MINSGVVAAIHVADVRGDPCGAVRRQSSALHHKGHHVAPATYIAATTPELITGISNSVFLKFLKYFKCLNIQ